MSGDGPRLDHPGDVHFFHGYGPAPVLGPCPHSNCPHNALSEIAYGPDLLRYTLNQCDVGAGCNGDCRAWHDERVISTTPWLQVGTYGRVVDRDLTSVQRQDAGTVTAGLAAS